MKATDGLIKELKRVAREETIEELSVDFDPRFDYDEAYNMGIEDGYILFARALLLKHNKGNI